MWVRVATDRQNTAVAGRLLRPPDSKGASEVFPVSTRDTRGGLGMATVLNVQTIGVSKIRFAHRYKMVVHKKPKQAAYQASRIWAEAPDAGHTRRGNEAGEMWTRNVEAPEAGRH
ncbi:MAG: hypothetical protein DWI24_07965 [Planctomycetota bacterium]|nr:MAG: hypothetical protein DWI24_07965 [Planctomycetota bacterium]